MTFARNPGGARADEAGWPWSHRRTFLERLGAQGYVPYTLGEYRSIAGRFCEAIEKRAARMNAMLASGAQAHKDLSRVNSAWSFFSGVVGIV